MMEAGKYRDGNWLWTSDWGLASGYRKEALQARMSGSRSLLPKEKPSEGCYSDQSSSGEYRIMEDPFEWNVSFKKTDPASSAMENSENGLGSTAQGNAGKIVCKEKKICCWISIQIT